LGSGSAGGGPITGFGAPGGGATIRGLAIDGFQGAGIFVGSAASANLFTGNFVGTDVTGTVSRPNGGGGIDISQSDANTIGGLTAPERNLISGNGGAGIVIAGSTNLIEGNFIGPDSTGAAGLANAGDGVSILSGFGNTIGGTIAGAGNSIAFNTAHGVVVDT